MIVIFAIFSSFQFDFDLFVVYQNLNQIMFWSK